MKFFSQLIKEKFFILNLKGVVMPKITEQRFKKLFNQCYKAEDRWEKKPVEFWNEKGVFASGQHNSNNEAYKGSMDKQKEYFDLSALLKKFSYDNDLSGFDLSNMIFKNVSFVNVDLSRCDFSGSDVSYANFAHSITQDTNIYDIEEKGTNGLTKERRQKMVEKSSEEFKK